MAKAKADNSFLAALFQARIFKASQGRIVRQVTFLILAIVFVVCAWRLNSVVLINLAEGQSFLGMTLTASMVNAIQWGIPTLIAALGLWISYAIVNWPPFANFLISVEAEMDKVSWATLDYLRRATVVVLMVMIIIGTYLFVWDIVWQQVFTLIRFLPGK